MGFLKLVFLTFLYIKKKYCCKLQQYPLKPTTENDAISFRSFHHFYENIFQEHFKEHGGFLEILKQVFRVHFPEFSLPTYFLSTINY